MTFKESAESPLLVVRQTTLEMSQLSDLGHAAAEAKMEGFNTHLFSYLYRLHEILPGLVAPVYHLILLEYELQRQQIPYVTDQTIEEYDADEANNMDLIPPTIVRAELRKTMLTDKQLVLVTTVDNYIDALRLMDPVLTDPTHYGIRHMYFLLREQAINDRNPS